MNYPEHDKMAAVKGEAQAIGAFLDSTKYQLGAWDKDSERFWPIHLTIEQVLAEHFNIDLNLIEQEKRAMLEEIRAMNAKG